MTPEVYQWVKDVRDGFRLKNKKVLDIGSRDFTGGCRDLFKNYIGLDINPGRNVDVVASSHSLPYSNESFDVVLCLEMLEHDTNFFQTIAEVQRVLKRGGFFLLTARGNGYESHDYPNDFWRFTVDGFRHLLSPFAVHTEAENLKGIFGWGVK